MCAIIPNSFYLMEVSHPDHINNVVKHCSPKVSFSNRTSNVCNPNSRHFIRPPTSCWNFESWHFSRFCQFNNHKCSTYRVTGHKEGFRKCIKHSSHYRMPKRINGVHALSIFNPKCSRNYLTINVNDRIITL